MKILKVHLWCLVFLGAASSAGLASDYQENFLMIRQETERLVDAADIEGLARLREGLQQGLQYYLDMYKETPDDGEIIEGMELYVGRVNGYNEIAKMYELPEIVW